MKNMTKRSVSLISAILLCAGSTVSAFAEAGQDLYLRGDINRDGAVTVEDAQLALVAYTNTVAEKPTGFKHPVQMEAANVLCDNEFDVADVQCILKYYVENTVSKRTVTWDQVTGRDKLTVPDTGEELVIRAATNYYDLEVMIRQFTERHPEYKGKVRAEYLSLPDENGAASWKPEEWEEYIEKAEDTDIFYMDKWFMFNCVNNDTLSFPVSALGFTDSDFANMYPYTLEIGTSLNGDLKALTATATPSGFIYRTDLAEKYLGVKTPAEMQKLIGSWEDFEKTAKTVRDKSEGKTALTEGGIGMDNAVLCNLTEPWFDENLKETVPEQLRQVASRYESFSRNGYLCDDYMFSESWEDTLQSDALLGYFIPNWLLKDDLLFIPGFGDVEDRPFYGKYNLVQGPAAYHWSDQYLFVSPHCDNKTLAYEFLSEFTVNEETMTAFANETGDFLNNSSVMKKFAASDKGTASLGGQKIIGLLDEIAAASHSLKEYTPACENLSSTFMFEVREAVENGTPIEDLYQREVEYVL